MRVIRKALGLLIVDIVLIIGIFVLQFRTDSTILEKIGNLQVTLALTEAQDNISELKNKLQVSYNGINFYCDDQNPAQVIHKGSDLKTNVVLKNWEKDDLSFRFDFSDDVSIVFTVNSDSPEATLSTLVKLPSHISSFYLPYNFNYNMKIQKDEGNRVVVDGRRSSWEISASSLGTGYITFTRENAMASYSVYDNTHTFSFETLADSALASSSAFNSTVSAFKNNMISVYKANTVESNLTEQAIVSYVAAQAEKGNYLQAVEEIPQSFKKGKTRTYLSTVYINNLTNMNAILDQTLADNEQLITRSASTPGLEIFTVRNLAAYMAIHPNQNAVVAVLQKAATADISTANLAQITGILQVYIELTKYNSDLAQILSPVLEVCVDRIEKACSYDGVVLTISENDTFLSVVQAVETGITLMRYGAAIGNQIYIKAGYVIVNSYISENSSFDLRTLSNLYPILAFDNWYYPHFTMIDNPDGYKMWAWTCAKSIDYVKDPNGTISIAIDFPENYTHYVIIKGVPVFKTIYIYNMAFRTDPRFESYNSSGYVYYQETKTLLLKSRHKQKVETVRLELYGSDYVAPSRPVAKPAEPAPKPAPAAPKPEETPVAAAPAETESAGTPETETPVSTETTDTDSSAAEAVEESTPEEVTSPITETAEDNGGKKKKKH